MVWCGGGVACPGCGVVVERLVRGVEWWWSGLSGVWCSGGAACPGCGVVVE